jgi:cysteine desulfurase
MKSAASTPPVYLDNAATTPLRPEVRAALEPFLTNEAFGNPSSSHRFGRAARALLEDARRQLAAALGVESRSVFFTSGGTEADNLAVLGGALAARAAGRPFRVAVSSIEHKAVLDAARAVEAVGGEAVVLPVGGNGQVEFDAVREALDRGLGILSVMWVNNEVGVVQDIPAIASTALDAGAPLHTDAVQAVGKIPCPLDHEGIALATVSGHKIGAPKGIGALIARDPASIHPLQHGGSQQRGLRPGTENIMGAVALAVAVELAVREQEETAAAIAPLRERLERAVVDAVPDARVNAGAGPRAPHISSLAFPGADAAALLIQLDLAGIACSSGSACASGSAEPSHVLQAMGLPDDVARGSLRFSFSRGNTDAEITRVLAVLPDIVARTRGVA